MQTLLLTCCVALAIVASSIVVRLFDALQLHQAFSLNRRTWRNASAADDVDEECAESDGGSARKLSDAAVVTRAVHCEKYFQSTFMRSTMSESTKEEVEYPLAFAFLAHQEVRLI